MGEGERCKYLVQPKVRIHLVMTRPLQYGGNRYSIANSKYILFRWSQNENDERQMQIGKAFPWNNYFALASMRAFEKRIRLGSILMQLNRKLCKEDIRWVTKIIWLTLQYLNDVIKQYFQRLVALLSNGTALLIPLHAWNWSGASALPLYFVKKNKKNCYNDRLQ